MSLFKRLFGPSWAAEPPTRPPRPTPTRAPGDYEPLHKPPPLRLASEINRSRDEARPVWPAVESPWEKERNDVDAE